MNSLIELIKTAVREERKATAAQMWQESRRSGSYDTTPKIPPVPVKERENSLWSGSMSGGPTGAASITPGSRVRVNSPGHPNHGDEGKVSRQQSQHFAVAFPHNGKVEFFDHTQLRKVD